MATKQKKPMAKTIIKAAVIIGVLIIMLSSSPKMTLIALLILPVSQLLLSERVLGSVFPLARCICGGGQPGPRRQNQR